MPTFQSIEDFEGYTPKNGDSKVSILVGMGTCGIAAGADKVIDTLKEQVRLRQMENVEIKQVGCLGLCFCEPNVEVRVKNMPDTLYGKVDANFAIKIVEEHVIDKRIINENLYDIPYIDILK